MTSPIWLNECTKALTTSARSRPRRSNSVRVPSPPLPRPRGSRRHRPPRPTSGVTAARHSHRPVGRPLSRGGAGPRRALWAMASSPFRIGGRVALGAIVLGEERVQASGKVANWYRAWADRRGPSHRASRDILAWARAAFWGTAKSLVSGADSARQPSPWDEQVPRGTGSWLKRAS